MHAHIHTPLLCSKHSVHLIFLKHSATSYITSQQAILYLYYCIYTAVFILLFLYCCIYTAVFILLYLYCCIYTAKGYCYATVSLSIDQQFFYLWNIFLC